ncbi:hypothetical protein LNKW23_12550 [Paralimibaculum aggregatum]|uniref:Uncharacterized protein n=1 Tax=Paralimibaculum aggregatum TaxID=3036245 RepID=A0ABQ6LK37_9RHOB|nr:hypothetical protein LNKW23_12550 [Limibaculum sp. NKW23]
MRAFDETPAHIGHEFLEKAGSGHPRPPRSAPIGAKYAMLVVRRNAGHSAGRTPNHRPGGRMAAAREARAAGPPLQGVVSDELTGTCRGLGNRR